MKTYLDCFPCMLNQALEAARVATPDRARQREILNRVMGLLMELRLDASPPEIARKTHRLIRELSGNPDPYKDLKHDYNERASSYYDPLQFRWFLFFTDLFPCVDRSHQNFVDPYRLRYIFNRMLSKIRIFETHLLLYLIICAARDTNTTRISQSLDPCSDINTIAIDPISIVNNITDVDTDSELQSLFLYKTFVLLL